MRCSSDTCPRGVTERVRSRVAHTQVLYALDPQFQENCNVLFQSLGDAPESPAEVGAFLARNLPALGFPEPLPRWTATGQGVQPTPEKEEEEDD